MAIDACLAAESWIGYGQPSFQIVKSLYEIARAQIREIPGIPEIESLTENQIVVQVFINSLLPDFDDERYPYMRLIDPYGSTMFNRYQMKPLRNELRQLISETKAPYHKWILEKLDDLALECEEAIHHYLLFLGD